MTLALTSEPLQLADGRMIDPATGKLLKEKKTHNFTEIPSASEAQEIVAKSRKSIADLPVAPQQMNGLSLVCFYTMWGLSNQDIAIQAGCTVDQVKAIKKLPEYLKLHEDIFKSVMETEATDVRGFFQQKAREAAATIVNMMDEEGALGLTAAKDVLDRAGHRPADVVEHRHRMDNALVIEYVKKDNVEQSILPAIDAHFEEVE
jgi:hypothetical protein